jgi:hypothetical protein
MSQISFAWRRAATDDLTGKLCDWCSRRGAGASGTGHLEIEVSPGLWFSSFIGSKGKQPPLGSIFPEGPQFVVRDHPSDDWIVRHFPITQAQHDILIAGAVELVYETVDEKGIERGHHGYDRWGVSRFVIPTIEQSVWDYFCSEACVELCQQIGWFAGREPWRMSPNHVLGYINEGRLEVSK